MELVNDRPRVLGNRYEVGDLLGRGGMAEVHLGRDARLGRSVAIKLLRTDLARDPTFQARFRREAQSAAALNHPSIVAVYDTGEEQMVEAGGAVVNLPYIVMEHVEGQTLRDKLAEGGHLDVDHALDIATGVLAALEYSHRIGIVHRDIKPANVMLTPVGDVKVMDFGIARAMADASSTMTQTQAVIGTAQYLSPEQARGEQVDTRSDLYSGGCLLYELLTGRPPFVADSPVAVAYQHVREQPIPPSRLVPGIPDSVDRIVLHALAKGREERYQSAAEFRADVEAARAGQQVSAVPTMAAAATTQYVPTADATGTRAMGPMAAGAVGGGLLGAETGVGGPPFDPYGQGIDQYGVRRQQREAQRSSRGPILVAIAVVIVLALVGYLVTRLINNGGNGGNGTGTVAIASVVGQPEEVAKQTLVDQGFAANNITTKKAASSDVDEGKVSAQDPPASTTVATTTAIVLTISSGPNAIEVPDVSGKTQTAARQAIESAGLTVGDVTTEENTSENPNRVTRTVPAAGDQVAPNTQVKIYLSSPTVTMPNLIDKTEKAAKAQLKKVDLNVDTASEPSADAAPGTVIRTSPDAGTKVERGSTVTLVLAEKPDTTPTETPSTTPSPSPSVSVSIGTG
jgi:eukaryotic-like serine/threonine-protein kinase